MFGPVELRELRKQVGAFAAGLDAALVTATQANAMVDDAAAIEKMAATVKALLAARVAETEVATGEGDRSAAHALARKTGTTVGKAADAIRTARRLRDQPTLEAAARRGEVSPEQATAISEAAAANPNSEDRLVGQAAHSSLAELRAECERTRAAADRDGEERHDRILAARFARRRSCPDGSGEILYRSTPEQVAEIWSVLSGYANEAFAQARREGRREPAQAYAADGMLAMARAAAGGAAAGGEVEVSDVAEAGGGGEHATAAGAAPASPATPATPARRRPPTPTRIVVRIDWDALVRGWVVGEETCEIAGVGQVPVSVVRAMMQTDDPFLAAVVTRGQDVVNVAHLGRRPSAHQLSALDWLAPTCRAEGCDAAAGLECDHRHDWAATRITLLAWIDRLCSHDHDLKTYEGWALVPERGNDRSCLQTTPATPVTVIQGPSKEPAWIPTDPAGQPLASDS